MTIIGERLHARSNESSIGLRRRLHRSAVVSAGRETEAGEIFKKSLAYAKKVSYLKSRKIKIALDSTLIFGRGAVKDTYNLLAHGIVKLMTALATRESLKVGTWASYSDLARYLASSIKGTAEINWDDPSERKAFLVGIVADADRLLILARTARKKCPRNSPEALEIAQAAELLSSLLAKGIERTGGVSRQSNRALPKTGLSQFTILMNAMEARARVAASMATRRQSPSM